MGIPLNIGVVGLGYWGPNLARNFHTLPDSKLTAICDLDKKRIEHVHSLYPGAKGTVEFKELLDQPELDALAISTAVPAHYPLAKAGLLAGKHVLIEKPLASSSDECEDLIRIATEKNLVLMVGHTFLYSPEIRKIKEIVDSGEIGDIRYISARRLNLGLFQEDINVTWDLAPHDISIILHIMGKLPEVVNCQGSAHITPGIEDVTALSLNFKNEQSALIHSSWLDPRKVREMTIVGSKKMILFDDVAPQEKIKIFDARVDPPAHYDSFAEFHYAYHHGDMSVPYVKPEEPLRNECQHFIDCIVEGKTPLTSGADGAGVVSILEAASESLLHNGAPVDYSDRWKQPAQHAPKFDAIQGSSPRVNRLRKKFATGS